MEKKIIIMSSTQPSPIPRSSNTLHPVARSLITAAGKLQILIGFFAGSSRRSYIFFFSFALHKHTPRNVNNNDGWSSRAAYSRVTPLVYFPEVKNTPGESPENLMSLREQKERERRKLRYENFERQQFNRKLLFFLLLPVTTHTHTRVAALLGKTGSTGEIAVRVSNDTSHLVCHFVVLL